MLAGSDYDYLEGGSATASSGELDSEGLQEDFRFPISNRPELLPDSGPRRGADLPDPYRFDLQSR